MLLSFVLLLLLLTTFQKHIFTFPSICLYINIYLPANLSAILPIFMNLTWKDAVICNENMLERNLGAKSRKTVGTYLFSEFDDDNDCCFK